MKGPLPYVRVRFREIGIITQDEEYSRIVPTPKLGEQGKRAVTETLESVM